MAASEEVARTVFLSKLLLPFLNFEQLCNFRLTCKRMMSESFKIIIENHYFIVNWENRSYIKNMKHIMIKEKFRSKRLKRINKKIFESSAESLYLRSSYTFSYYNFTIPKTVKIITRESKSWIKIHEKKEATQNQIPTWNNFIVTEFHIVSEIEPGMHYLVDSETVNLSVISRESVYLDGKFEKMRYLKVDKIGNESLPKNIEEIHVEMISNQNEIDCLPDELKILAIDFIPEGIHLNFSKMIGLKELYILNGNREHEIPLNVELRRDYEAREIPEKRIT